MRNKALNDPVLSSNSSIYGQIEHSKMLVSLATKRVAEMNENSDLVSRVNFSICIAEIRSDAFSLEEFLTR